MSVRADRQRLSAEIARLNRRRSATRYVTVQTSAIALHTAYSRVDEQSELWNERGRQLAGLAEAETVNSAHVANFLLDETATGTEETEETSLTDELSYLSMDLHNRWEGARFAINPRNPDREVIVELINMKAPDAAARARTARQALRHRRSPRDQAPCRGVDPLPVHAGPRRRPLSFAR